VWHRVIAKVKLDKVSIADLKARHADAAADVGRGILLTALSAKVADMLVEGREAGPHRLAEPACLAAVQAMPWHHSSVRWLIEPVTGILNGRLDLETRDGRTCGGMAISKESTQ
jgi:hypothetical protein